MRGKKKKIGYFIGISILSLAVGVGSLFALLLLLEPSTPGTPGQEDTSAVATYNFADVEYDRERLVVSGRVVSSGGPLANPEDFRVLLFIKVDGAYFVKPDFQKGKGAELREMNGDGEFRIPAYHSSALESDATATDFELVLVSADFPGIADMQDIDSARLAQISRHVQATSVEPGDKPVEIDDKPAETDETPVEPGETSAETDETPFEPSEPSETDETSTLSAPVGGAFAFADVVFDKDTQKKTQYVRGVVEQGGQPVADPGSYHIILFILVGDQYYVKPDFMEGQGKELSPINEDGSFSIRAYHPDAYAGDSTATKFALFLVPDEYPGISQMNQFLEAQDASVAEYLADV
jgi:hypothetical protein